MKDYIIEVRNLNKTFPEDRKEPAFCVLDNIQLQVEKEEFICLLGPSGCGKSTLLRLVAGLEEATSGEILYHGKAHHKPRKEIGMVFQNYSLMPWLSVYDNIKLGLDFNRTSEKEKKRLTQEYLEIIGMSAFAHRLPHELSGGMRQRVAIARALVNDPEIVLMDEPFGALDAYTRIVLQKELLRIWQRDRKTILFVTHSVDEALYLADRVLLMSRNQGKLEEEIRLDLPRPRDRSHPEYARLNQALLDRFESLHAEA